MSTLGDHDAAALWAGATRTPTGCLIPRHRARVNGYAVGSHRGRTVRLHRRAWEIAHGRKIPTGRVVRHRSGCQRACFEPSHLLSGTQRANSIDAMKAGTLRLPYGVHLNPSLVREIRRAHKSGATFADLGRRLGVCPETARAAVSGRSWAWVRPS